METISSGNRDYDLWVLLNQARDMAFKVRRNELHKYEITSMQAAVFFVIQYVGDGATPAEISRLLTREHNSVSDILKRMEKVGLVRKTNDLHRKNLVRVTLTESGREAYRRSTELESISNIMSSLSDEEYQQLTSCLIKIRDVALKELGLD